MIIQTERLILRPFLESDAADAFEYLVEPMANCFRRNYCEKIWFKSNKKNVFGIF